MSEYEKVEIACGFASSVTVNCFACSPLMGFPDLSVTSTSIRTKSDCVRRTGDWLGFAACGDAGMGTAAGADWFAGGLADCCGDCAEASPAATRATSKECAMVRLKCFIRSYTGS